MALNFSPIVLIILDGFGIAPAGKSNAITLAKKPFFDSLVASYPTVLLEASSEAVGLPWGEVGNSEVGHLTIGSGVLRYQSLPRIDKSISTGQFFKLPPLTKVIERVKSKKTALHIVGLIGKGGVHSSQDHLEALINFARTAKINKKVYLHLFLDGRDSARDAGKDFVVKLLQLCQKEKTGEIATISGRFYGMDRNNNWDRIKKSYDAIVSGQSEKTAADPLKAVEESYARNVFDEEFEPTVITDRRGRPIATINDGDTVIFFNFRSDRARQLTRAIIDPQFKEFESRKFSDLLMVTFTEYEKNSPVEVLFEPENITTPLAKVFSDYNIKQLHIAETEKYAHVTFFLNGGMEEPFAGEERILVPSPAVASYDQKPEMSAKEVTDHLLDAIKSEKFGFVVVNYANPDMVGHTGNLQATIKAVETVDECLAKVVPAVLEKKGAVFIVGDHGNAEEMFNLATGDVDKEHNMYPVPFIVAAERFANQGLQAENGDLSLIQPAGILSDVAPTIIALAGLPEVSEMTGTCVVR